MAAVCEVCGKKPSFGNRVPFSQKKTRRRWNPNIQRVRALVGGAPKRVSVCTACLKSGKVTKAVRGRSNSALEGRSGRSNSAA